MKPGAPYTNTRTSKRKLLDRFSQSLTVLAPRKSRKTLDLRDGFNTLVWDQNNQIVNCGQNIAKRTLTRHAKEVLDIVYTKAGFSSQAASDILASMLSRKEFAPVFSKLQENLKVQSQEESDCEKLVQGIKRFIACNSRKGTQPRDQANALDAVLTAVLHTEGVSEDRLCCLVGTNRSPRWRRCAENARQLKETKTPFVPTARATRKDCYQDAARRCVEAWSHSDFGSRSDTNSNQVYKIWNKDLEKFEKHERRVWHSVGKTNNYQLFLQSTLYDEYQNQNPGKTIGRTIFTQHLCPCIHNPNAESCVDIIESGLLHVMRGIRDAVQYDSTLRSSLADCDCPRHQAYSAALSQGGYTDPPPMWENLLSGTASSIIKATCCERQPQPFLCKPCTSESDDDNNQVVPPKLIPWKCTGRELREDGTLVPQCQSCGIEKKLRIRECPVLSECTKEIKVLQWKEVPRTLDEQGNVTSEQLELTEEWMPMSEAVDVMISRLEEARLHYTQTQWLAVVRELDITTLESGELLVFTDFAATLDLRAGETDNCSVDGHAVVDNFVVLHSPRNVSVEKEPGTVVTHRINECEVWHMFGDSRSKGKKNDHVFHNASLDMIVKYYNQTLGQQINTVTVWTDNCPNQYKCKQNFLKIATFALRSKGIVLRHRFAQKYHFKGVWDGAGKVVKDHIRNEENSMRKRYATAKDCFENLRGGILETRVCESRDRWLELERDRSSKLLGRKPFTHTRRHFGFATDKEDEWRDLCERYQGAPIAFTDRDNVPTMKTIEGTRTLHSVEGSRFVRVQKGEWEHRLTIASMPCHCTHCRNDSLTEQQKCRYKNIRDSREKFVCRTRDNIQNQTQSAESISRQVVRDLYLQYDEEVKRYLGIDKVLSSNLRSGLQRLGLATSGAKHEMARRLLEHVHMGEQQTATVAASREINEPLRNGDEEGELE